MLFHQRHIAQCCGHQQIRVASALDQVARDFLPAIEQLLADRAQQMSSRTRARLDLVYFPASYTFFPVWGVPKVVVTMHDTLAGPAAPTTMEPGR